LPPFPKLDFFGQLANFGSYSSSTPVEHLEFQQFRFQKKLWSYSPTEKKHSSSKINGWKMKLKKKMGPLPTPRFPGTPGRYLHGHRYE